MERTARRETIIAVARLVASFAVLVAIVSVIGWAFRDELARFGTWFVARFGVGGIVLGAFLADGIHFPLPPQFYLLTGLAGGYSHAVSVLAVLLGSELGGLAAFSLARLAGKTKRLERWMASPRKLIDRMMAKRGYLGLALATLLPVSYCLLCMAGGAMGLPYKAYAVLGAMRVPKILLSYVLIVMAWHS